jgi:membrane fusion protein, multidrug efflux system
MKKSIFILSLIIIASSCSMDNPEMIKQQIKKKKEQVSKLNEQIALMEGGIETDSASADEGFSVPVSVKKLNPEAFEHFIDITGKLEAEEDAFISPEMNGQIKKIYVKEGQSVKKGQLLVALNTAMIESNINQVKTGLALATKLYDKQKELWDQNIGSEMQFLEAKNAKESAQASLETLQAQLDMARIRAPFSGLVETIMLKEGELAAPGMQVIQLVSLDNLKIYGNISERYMSSIQKGDEVIVKFPDAGDLSIDIPIHRVGNVIDDKSRTFRIEMKIDNTDKKLKPNMYTTIKVKDFSSDNALVVPAIIVKQDAQGDYIYVANNDQGSPRAEKRYVKVGLTNNDLTIINEGVKPGEDVIVNGYTQVSNNVGINIR